MSLDIPTLDDRPYDELLGDARKRIPVYSETWTDHNASDPGITVLELLAWLTETYAYQLDRITDAHRLKYLALLGEKPRPPHPARADLRMRLPPRMATATVPAETKLVATTETDDRFGFETAATTTLTAATLDRVVTDGPRGRLDHTTANETPGMQFAAFGESAARGSALYLGFDGDPFAGTGELTLTVDLFEEDLPDPATHGDLVDAWSEPTDFEPTVGVAWEYCSDYDEWHDDAVWRTLDVTTDGTDRFYRSGQVTVEKPRSDGWVSAGGRLFGDAAARWIRCRVTDEGHEIAPRVDAVAVNVVPVEHRWRVDSEAGEPMTDADGNATSTGLPGQRFSFERGPVLSTDVAVRVGGEEWEQREDFDASASHSKHYVVDPSYRQVRFGDGSRGTIPPVDAPIAATRYVGGGGAAANVSANATWRFEESDVRFRNTAGKFSRCDPNEITVDQRGAATGGADAESIEDAFDRLAEDRRIPYRAVTAADYEYVATHTPGLRFGRAAAWVVEGDPVEKRRGKQSETVTGGCSERHGRRKRSTEPTAESCGRRVTRIPAGMRAERRTDEPPTNDGEQDGRRNVDDAAPADELDSDPTAASDSETESPGDDEAVEYCEPHRSVHVVIVPYSRSARPTPSDGFVDAVEAHLRRHRLLTDRVSVRRPTYVGVGVDADVRLEPGYSASDRVAAVEEALDDFVDPLSGFEGEGWPFGRALYRSELYETVENVPGVDCVTRLDVAADGGRFDGEGNVVVDPWALLTPTDHAVTARVGSQGGASERCDRR